MGFRIPVKFEGLNEEGLTFEQYIEGDVRRYIVALAEWHENDGRTELVPLTTYIVGMYEKRLFSEIMNGLRCYYNEYLELVSEEFGEKLKAEIVEVAEKYDCRKNLEKHL